MKKYILTAKATHLGNPSGEFKAIHELIDETTQMLKYPITATGTGRYGDTGEEIVQLPNRKTVSLRYFEHNN